MEGKKIGLEVRNPNLYPDPNRISNADLYKYRSLNEIKLQQSYRNYFKSAKYIGNYMNIGGIVAGCLILSSFADKAAKHYVFGHNGNGGDMLGMYSSINQHDYSYNREFQRMRYLSEQPSKDDETDNVPAEFLADLGVKIPNHGNNHNVLKRSPHYKYY